VRKILIVILSSVFVSSCHDSKEYTSTKTTVKKFQIVDFAELLSRPNDFHGKPIETTGIFRAEFEHVGLYKSRWDSRGHNYKKAFWIEFDDSLKINDEEFENLNNKRITVRGTVDAHSQGHLSEFAGSLTGITYIREIF